MSPGLREACQAFLQLGTLALSPLPETPRVTAPCDRVERRLEGRSVAPSLPDLDALRNRLAEAHATGDWSGLAPRDWRRAPFCLPGAPQGFLRDEPFVGEFLRHLEDFASARVFKSLARSYLDTLEPGSLWTTACAACLERNKDSLRGGLRRLADLFPLFEPEKIVDAMAAALAGSSVSMAAFCREAGLHGSLGQSGLARLAFQAAMRRLGDAMPAETNSALQQIQRIQTLAERPDKPALHFDQQRVPAAALADALLLPFARRDPGEDARRSIEGFLLRHLDDPRLPRNRWPTGDSQAKNLFLAWLTRASLDQFLNVVDQTLHNDDDAKRMWPMRREFWYGYYNRKAIHQAWVAFASDGALYVKRHFRDKNNPLRHAMLRGSVEVIHAVLLLRLGNLTIADWSHNGTCRIWRHGNKHAPSLYHLLYEKKQLMQGADFETRHQGKWRDKVALFIKDNTSII